LAAHKKMNNFEQLRDLNPWLWALGGCIFDQITKYDYCTHESLINSGIFFEKNDEFVWNL
jgi:hypothetical protein